MAFVSKCKILVPVITVSAVAGLPLSLVAGLPLVYRWSTGGVWLFLGLSLCRVGLCRVVWC